ncbi:hypothetical protein HO173_005916 [Letharia columbiana]|uniref:Transmembrane protein n=1 Tax=Letharia columbiana TaxID=112416 RepID=A0A8H6FVT9_9LECA|nr:uncharacterized protein HO173_005916 [Letharia columbiana]KAF6235721.1 hypothetical protein HO173_005916 [Letharia columbiana]
MGPEIQYDDGPQEPRERTLEMSLPSSQNDDKSQEVKKTVSEISLPSPQPMTPNRANRPIVTPKNPPLYTLKRQKDFRDRDIYFAIKWACGILTVAASIVFGIWAPLSYEATIADNDTQNSMVTVLSNAKDLASTANIIASNALDTASAQRDAMASLYSTIGLMGQLAVMEFCYGQQTLSACGAYVQGAEHSLESLIDRLGHRAVSTTATEPAGPSVATVTPEGRGAEAVPDAAPPPPSNNAASDPGAAAPTEQQPAS